MKKKTDYFIPFELWNQSKVAQCYAMILLGKTKMSFHVKRFLCTLADFEKPFSIGYLAPANSNK